MAPGPAAPSRHGRRCLGRRFYLMGGDASRRQGGGRGWGARRESSRRKKGFAGAAGAVGSARRLAGRTGRIASGWRLTVGGAWPGFPQALLYLPAGQILPQRFCLPLLPGGSLLRLIPDVVHATVPFSNPAPGPSSRPKVAQCQPRKPGKSSAGQAVTGRRGRGALACQHHPRMACSAPSTEPP